MTHYELAEKAGAKITSKSDDNGTGLWATFHTFEFSDVGLLHLISLVEEATKEKAAKVCEKKTLRERMEMSRFMKDETIRPCKCAAAIRSMK